MPSHKTTLPKGKIKSSSPHFHLKYKICISGAADTRTCAKDALERTEELGSIIAKRGCILVTGATTGAPLWAAKGAKEAGGFVIGLSPAASLEAHVKTYHLPVDYHDIIVYTGFGYAGRNLLLTRSSDAVITVCGRIGTLNEFTIAFEDQKPQGILSNMGGTSDMIPDILEKAGRGFGKSVFDPNPEKLVDKVIALIRKEQAKVLAGK